MSTENLQLPLIDLSEYISPTSSDGKEKVIIQVREACQQYGFFQVKGHGVPRDLQSSLLQSIDKLFNMPQEKKLQLSYLKNPSRRGYEASGMSIRDGDLMPDAKEAFYIGREDPKTELSGFYGPNVWPDLPEEEFRGPVWKYYQTTSALGKTIWEILLEGLGYAPSMLEAFAKRPLVQMKMIRYPTPPATLPGQFGVGAHNDFGGVTVLLQQPGKDGLEVWLEDKSEWLAVPALEDVYIINCGDMVQNCRIVQPYIFDLDITILAKAFLRLQKKVSHKNEPPANSSFIPREPIIMAKETSVSSEETLEKTSTLDGQKDFRSKLMFESEQDPKKNNPVESDNTMSPDEYPQGLRLALLVGSVMMTTFVIALDQTIVGTAIPKITDEFHGLKSVSWYGSAYFMTLGGFQSSWGKAYKYFALKPTFILSIGIFELGSLICGVAPNSVALIVGRAISGLGGAGIATGGTTIIAFCSAPRKRPILMGLLGVTYAFAAVAGPVVGGIFSDRVTWRWCFYINLPIGAAAVAVIWGFFQLPSAAKVVEATWKEKFLQMDPLGVALAMSGIVCFILALEYGGISHPWDSSIVIGLLVGFVLIMITLGVWEFFQGEYAMVVPRLLRKRSLWATSIFQFFFAGSYFLVLYYIPIYLQSIKGDSPIRSGVDNLPMVIAVGFFVLAGGMTVAATGQATPFMALGAALCTVGAGLFYTLDIETPSARWIGYQILYGAATSFPYMNCLNVAHANVDAADIASVTSILQFFQTLGGAFSISAAQSAFVNSMVGRLPVTAPGVDPALVVATGAAELRNVFSQSELPGILLAYMEGIKTAFAVSIGMMAAQELEPIAIVGSACRFPGGANSPSTLWTQLEKPRDLCLEIPPDRFSTTGFYHPDGSHHGTSNVQHAYLLQEDIRVFDAGFFNISPNEADSMDPQQRLLVETVYEALERGGHTLEALRGSDTAVYTGTMSVDYTDTGLRDLETLPTYFVTGTNRAVISNRVSYVFDWHGPSMTIDTACSSSLIAVHQSVQSLRSGESRVAVACGTQLILNPETFIMESKLNMLSPTGRSRMWDADADGYARGEGVAAVILKRLSDAVADGDHIESIIRETGTNQDGRTSGLTVPSTDAQAALIRQTYARAGLDPVNNDFDRPQVFEAHGTGTKIGDPNEAAAIHQSLGQHITGGTPLYVGSVKTVMGHLEGAAGLAGLLKGSSSIQKGMILPNLLFNRLNPDIQPFYKGLHVPTQLTPWPELPQGVPRRVSVNSFGFGGSNAHAILEQYLEIPAQKKTGVSISEETLFTPFTFSAASENSLVAQLQIYSTHLQKNNDINLIDLAWTLQARRSQFSTKIAFAARTIGTLLSKIDAKIATVKQNPGSAIGTRVSSKPATISPRVLGVFTGQGAQWAAMGAELIRASDFVSERVQHLEESLAALPLPDRPQWSLREEMLAGANASRLAEAAVSQPLCTAIQIVLVDLLRESGVSFSAVVGHSSGEIAAAYAAGFISPYDAIRIAYYRGLYARLARSDKNNQRGAMLAVATSWEDASDLINLRAFKGRLMIAAHNSSASVTLSGDADAIIHAKKVFDEEKKFARLLQVDTAYHSHHMSPCGHAYVKALQECGVKVNKDPSRTPCAWFSSVTPSDKEMEPSEALQAIYWRDNMANAVLFAEAVKNAIASDDQISLAIEVGPHPALKGPVAQTIAEIRPGLFPYSGVLNRGHDDIEAFADALGFLWTQTGSQAVDFQSYQKAMSSDLRKPKLITDLPSYQWNHGRSHWSESRRSRKLRQPKMARHEVLGTLSTDSNAHDLGWSNVLKVSEIPWLEGHQLQGQVVFPAAGYVAMALEASKNLAGDRKVELFELHDLSLPRAIAFEEADNSGVETLVTLTKIQYQPNGTATADFSCYAVPVVISGSKQDLELMASCSIKIMFGIPNLDTLCGKPLEDYNMYPIDSEELYSSLLELGYGYTGPFRTLSSVKRRLGYSLGLIDSYPYSDADFSTYLVHPSTLDVAFQASILAYSAPGDDHLWSLHVPVAIGSIRVNPEVCALLPRSGSPVSVSSVLENPSESFSGCLDMFSEDGQHCMIQVDDLIIKPFAPATEADDRVMFTKTKFDFAVPNGAAITRELRPSAWETDLGIICERLCYYYLRKWNSELTDDDWASGQPHFLHLRNWVKHTLSTVSSGKNELVKGEWLEDSANDIKSLISKYSDEPDIKMITAVGENMVASVRSETTILEHMVQDALLDNHYKNCLGAEVANGFLADMMKQMTHRYPHMKILEIGAGTGGATKAVLEAIGGMMSSYTYTDISVGFFGAAEKLFKAYTDKMTFKILDIDKAPASQGFELHSYDIVIASNVLHATPSLYTTLVNTRKLVKPGGYLLLLELTNSSPLRSSMIFGGLPGWWLGVDDGRKLAPLVSPKGWHSVLRKAGFAGVDAITPEVNAITWPASIIASQAVDDKVQFLRRPLSSLPAMSSIYIDNLVILGNQTLDSARIGEELSEHLERFCRQVTILDGLPTEDEALSLSPMSTFINLVDIDSPIFKGITDEKMEGLKRVSEKAKHLLWVTQGALVDEPYHMASIAFSRVLRAEATHITLNNLDISDLHQPNISKFIAEHLLQAYSLDEWEAVQEGAQKILWSKEPEAFLEHGLLKIPRLVSSVDHNARLNSSRRVVLREVPISSSNISVSPPGAHSPASLVDLAPLIPHQEVQNRPVRIQSSSLMALQIISDTFLFLAVCKDITTKKPLVLLSTTNTCEMSPVISITPKDSSNGQSEDHLLISVASELLAEALIQPLASGSNILVHCSAEDRFLTATISKYSAIKAICVTFTYDANASDVIKDPKWTGLSARVPLHVLRKSVHQVAPSHFLDLTTLYSPKNLSNLSSRISQVLPSRCKTISLSALLQRQSVLPLSYNRDALTIRLEKAISAAYTAQEGNVEDLVVQLDHIHELSMPCHSTSAVHWPLRGLLKAEVQPLNTHGLFSKDKTYLLIGLSGKIGQSLCEWMVANGAGCVCLTSRRPDIDKRWMKSFQATNATVKVLAMDVTDKSSIESAVREIRKDCPPIAGIAHGAMVLHDSLFSRMSAAKMQEILGPKVDGANNLEDVFHDDKLDFFVMFSSVSSVLGNAGQSLYATGNGYLNGLARQRRRRGLAASTFDIGRVVGIGYVETAAQIVRDQLIGLGLPPISETTLRQSFAETIRMGVPNPQDKEFLPDAVLTVGIRHFNQNEDIKGPWFTNPLFSHCVIEHNEEEANYRDQKSKTSLHVSQQLTLATTKEQCLEILLDCFSAKLRVILQLDEQAIDYNAPLVELGIDSLVAVEVRSWFLKELKVDIPVLKVVGGASPAELCQRALEKLPDELLASIGKQVDELGKHTGKTLVSQLQDQHSTPALVPSSASEGSATSGSLSPRSHDSITTPISTPSDISDGPLEFCTPQNFSKSVPISMGQSRFWFLHHLLEDQRTHNVAYYYHITGNLHVTDLERATRIVTDRHESLRTCFVADQTDVAQASQKVLPSSLIGLEYKKITSVEEVSLEYAKLRMHEFDMRSGILLRLILLTLSPSSHYLLMYHHHIIMDGVSLQVFLSDLEKAYKGESLGPPTRQYPEFSVAQRQAYEKGEMTNELEYWRKIFPTSEGPPILPLLPMARTNSRAPMKHFDTHQVECRLAPSLVMRIRSVSRANRSTPFHLYLAAFKAMIFCFTDTQDLTIGVADAARNDHDVMKSIGFFLNLLPLRFRRQSNQTFADAIVEARNTSYGALENSRLPFDVLLTDMNVARSSSHSPFFQAFIDYRQGAQAKHPFGDCQFEIEKIDTGKTAYDITLDVTDSATDALVMFRGQKALYDLQATKLLSEIYVHFLEILTDNPTISLAATPLFSEKQYSQAVQIGRGPQLISEWPETLPHRIDQVCQTSGCKVALMDGTGKVFTYSDMKNRIEAIAEALQKNGVGAGSRVLVFQQAACDWVCSMLAIMRTGAIYVPLDLRNPMIRLAGVAKDCEPKAVVVDTSTLSKAPQLNVDASIIDLSTIKSRASTNIANSAQADSPAAILYTSGSTGTPKGIVVTHAGLRNEIEGYTKMWKLGAECVLQQSAFTFNHSSDQIYTGLVNGGTVYIVPWEKRGSPLEITEIIRKHSITYTKGTPSEYLMWMQYGSDNLRGASEWRFAFGGGENMTTAVVKKFSSLALPQLRVFNSYGPTEISISSTKMEIPYNERSLLESIGRIPCGYSLPNYNMFVVDEQLRPLPAGMPGELCIGGAGVSLGYFKNKELTSQQFVRNPFASHEDISRGWRTMYRTGDISHLNEDGAMVFHSRMHGDNQVKIRGIRIELSDIESNIISASKAVLNDAVVTLREGDVDLLVAHVVFASNHAISDKETFLEGLLANLPLPQYMIPVIAIPLSELPLTNHSKIDRKALKNMELPKRNQIAQQDTELTRTMLQLKAVWQDVLGKSIEMLALDINPSISFFAIGGNSLLVIRLQQRIRRAFNVSIPLVDLLGANTLAQMASKIDENSIVEHTNWEQETAPPPIPNFLKNVSVTPSSPSKAKIILVTGGTGFIANYLLPLLNANSHVSTIHCVAVRDNHFNGLRKLSGSSKIIYHDGNLAWPKLGLSEEDFRSLSSQVDVILHLGGTRSFWDDYNVLRSTNVLSTKELVKLAAPRCLPIHYISTIGVLPRERATSEAISAAASSPPDNGSNGYIATRWASERILERSGESLGISSTILRFLPSVEQESAPQLVLKEFLRFVDLTRLVPDTSGWEGRLEMIPAQQVARYLCDSLLLGLGADQKDKKTTQFFHYENRITITMAELSSYIIEQRGNEDFEKEPIVKWMGRIKKLGFDYLLTSHEAIFTGTQDSPEDAFLVSRR
ncbi:beta-ketoacyl synthase domain-containing protein [Phlyctema vagabunda]|uniref:Beta-ketoacyl synthase domain-containing protein n=1 Tax=Phlyctema vagabunda TaxID=108571 RepID=A0ABR4P2G6_9HELO